jgi:hypothetical protein
LLALGSLPQLRSASFELWAGVVITRVLPQPVKVVDATSAARVLHLQLTPPVDGMPPVRIGLPAGRHHGQADRAQ